jgi:hypothetical protein
MDTVNYKLDYVPEVLTASITTALAMEAVNPSETSVNFYEIRGATSQETVIVSIKTVCLSVSYFTTLLIHQKE